MIRRRALAALLVSGPAVAREDERLALAREIVARQRDAFPDPRTFILGSAPVPEAYRPLEAAIRAEAEAAEPAYRERLAWALAEGLSAEDLRAASAPGAVRGVVAASRDAERVMGRLNAVVVETIEAVAERGRQRACAGGEAEACRGR